MTDKELIQEMRKVLNETGKKLKVLKDEDYKTCYILCLDCIGILAGMMINHIGDQQ